MRGKPSRLGGVRKPMTRFFRFVGARLGLPLLLLTVGGCSLFFQRPSISVVDVSVGSVGLDGATAEIALEIDNPNRYDLDVSELRYSLAIPDDEEDGGWTVLLDRAVPDSTTVPGRETTRVTVEVPFEYSVLERAGETFLRRGARLPYRLRGHVRVTGPMTTVRVPFDREGLLDPLAELLRK